MPESLGPAGIGGSALREPCIFVNLSSSGHRLNLLLAGNFNADGKTDLVIELQDGYPCVLLSNGDGTFALYRF